MLEECSPSRSETTLGPIGENLPQGDSFKNYLWIVVCFKSINGGDLLCEWNLLQSLARELNPPQSLTTKMNPSLPVPVTLQVGEKRGECRLLHWQHTSTWDSLTLLAIQPSKPPFLLAIHPIPHSAFRFILAYNPFRFSFYFGLQRCTNPNLSHRLALYF